MRHSPRDSQPTSARHLSRVSLYADHQARMSDQLTAHHLAEPDVERSALRVLVQTKEPKIEWQGTTAQSAKAEEMLVQAA